MTMRKIQIFQDVSLYRLLKMVIFQLAMLIYLSVNAFDRLVQMKRELKIQNVAMINSWTKW